MEIGLAGKYMAAIGGEEETIENLNTCSARKEIKTKICEATFKSLKDIQKTHFKV